MSLASSAAPTTPRVRAASPPWVRFGVRRLGRLIVSLWVLVTAAFLMIHLIPGDPVRAALGPTAPAELVQARRESLRLDDPLLTQSVRYLRGVLTGDLGTSMTSQLPVSELISQRRMATLQLAVLAFLAAVAIASPGGAAMVALTRGGRARRSELAFTSTSMVLGTIPEFLLGVVLVYVFAVNLGWFPVAGKSGANS